jgi:hypothetical protein
MTIWLCISIPCLAVSEIAGMKIVGLFLSLLLCCLLLAEPGLAQQTGGNATSAEQRDIGKVQTRIEKSDQALGVVIQLARPGGGNVECNAVCYLPSSSKPVTWKCEPSRKCDLHCAVNPPVGGCN